MNFPPSESSAYFNPRSREGSDNICSKTGLVIQDFNPRSREGSDWVRAFLCALFEIFQSTLPRGERRSQLIGFMISKYFNPRSREGSDGRDHRKSGQHKHFNPRSREGSDFCFCHVLYLHFLFQSTLPRGERRGIQDIHKNPINFNPRSREGSDNGKSFDNCGCHNFNPRSREGSD